MLSVKLLCFYVEVYLFIVAVDVFLFRVSREIFPKTFHLSFYNSMG